MEQGDEQAASGDRPRPSQVAPSIFERFSEQDAADLIAAYPLAWLCTREGDTRHASLLPLLAEYGEDGRIATLLGHMARRNPLVPALARDRRALILFSGPQGYLSPELVSDRRWAPTWNYAQLRLEADVHFDEAENGHALETLVTAMERSRSKPWTLRDMGSRYTDMAGAIVAFRAQIFALEGRFKLGQDEKIEVLEEIIRNRPADDLTRWMQKFNQERILRRSDR